VLATWNVNSLRVRLPHLKTWLESTSPEVIALQETKLQDGDFPSTFFSDHGYGVLYSGQKTYNGVAIASRTPGTLVAMEIPGFVDTQRRLLHARWPEFQIVNVYVPNGAVVGSEKYAYKLKWLAAFRDYLASFLPTDLPTFVCGDFNIAPEDRDVHDPKAWEGSVLTSEPERDALRTILALGLKDCFRLFEQPAESYSWWDYRQGAFRRNNGLRIDLILGNAAASSGCRRCHIDKTPRTWERPSDHTPVLVKFEHG
jgi:exodeoxyribonuclease-3